MDRFPLELLQRTLVHLDFKSLRNATLSCRRIFYAFRSIETLIAGEILLRQIDYDVLPEAILVNKSWSLGEPSVRKGLEFAKNLECREPAPTKWNLADALPLARFHKKVNYLAIQAARDALQKQPRLLAMGEPDAPTREEICRFERALYRFQLFCNVVGRLSPVRGGELHNMFFKHFATWENEQLACIHEHLVRVVSKPFNFLVESDVTWGYLNVLYIATGSTDYAQEVLAQGIEKICRLSRATGYTRWHALLSRGEERGCEPLSLPGFLNNAFGGANPSLLLEFDESVEELALDQPFYSDPDPGPATMYEWMQRNRDGLVADPGLRIHRVWAFPFWNYSRLEAAGLLEDPKLPGLWIESYPGLDEFREPIRHSFLENMRRKRAEIWNAGGYGHYMFHDSSEIKWR